MFTDNKRRFREREEVWESEMQQLKSDIKALESKKKKSIASIKE